MGVFLQIILWILKLLGILLLIVLGVLLLVLVVPIRYEVGAEADAETKTAKGRVTWLLRAVSVRFGYAGAFVYSVKVLGIQVLPGKAKPAVSESNAVAMPEEAVIQLAGDGSVATAAPPGPSQMKDPVDEAVAQSTPPEQLLTDTKVAENDGKKGKKKAKTADAAPKEKVPLSEKLKSLQTKFLEIKAMVCDASNQAAVKHALREVGYLLKKILPRKLRAKGVVGFDDPATTGQMAGVLAVIYPYYGKAIQIEPDFEEKRLEGTVSLKGHIRLGIFVVALVRLVLDKNIRHLIGQVLKMVKPKQGGNQNGRKQ